MGDAAKIIELRKLLAERFPQAPHKAGAVIPTGIPRLDDLLEGGLWKGSLIELSVLSGSSGSALCIATLLHTLVAEGRWMALIDGQDSFDPQPIANEILAHLLWVRCRNTTQAMGAADLLLRDGNLPLVVLDLRLNPLEQLRRIHSSGWYRFQRLVEENATTLLAVTPHSMIPSAHAKLTLENRFTLQALSEEQNQLLEQLQLRLARRRFLAAQQEHHAQAG